MYVVSFNNTDFDIGGWEEGGDTEDYYGPNIIRLAAHINQSEEDFPMVFRFTEEDTDDAIGFFYADGDFGDDGRVAVMYEGNPDFPTFVP